MRFTFTAATERALAFASDWCNRTGREELDAESLLVGLLSESECRAAVMLAKHGVDIPSVCRQWPTLMPHSPQTACCPEGESPTINTPHGGDSRQIPFSPDIVRSPAFRRKQPAKAGTTNDESPALPFAADIDISIQAACARLDFLPRRPELATEHLLLGLASADHEVAVWLRQQGIDPDAIEAEIRRLHGYEIEERGEGRGERDEIERLAAASSRCDDRFLECGDSSPLFSRSASLCDDPDSSSNSGDESPHSKDTDVLRVLDAAANRAREGLRVVEDYVRFVLDDQHLTELCKQLRHDLTAALSQVSTDSRMAARETQEDVGTVLTTSAEQRRENLASVVRANFARLQESLRSLEEFGKLARPDQRWGGSCTATPVATVQLSPQQTPSPQQIGLSELFKQLRYRVYTLERAVEITSGSIASLAEVSLYVLADGCGSPEKFERLVIALIDAGVGAIQLRDKQLGDRDLLARARMLRALTRETPTLFIMNDRPDLAALSQADGVHIGQEELSVKDARRIVGPEMLVGVSTHNIEQARQAVLDGANYIGVGPTFPSATKQFEQFPGVELLKAVAAEIRLPAFAIGGIDRGNLPQVLAAGFSRIAVGAAVTSADDPKQAAKELLETQKRGHH